MKAQVIIKFSETLDSIQREVVAKAAKVLEKMEVDVVSEEIQDSDNLGVSIEVLEMGGISEIEISRFLSSLFSDKSLSGVSVALGDGEKTFKLPDESDECIDWFIME
ncbi:MAG: hypothetical protein JW806_01725 [Sedimentisphaerales bacterium]|nr:hypothetical protein [Sedimentisphaerales bacterium]